jgi:hypothetical protein
MRIDTCQEHNLYVVLFSDSSSSSDENYKPLRVTKNRGGSRVTDRLTLKGRNGNKNKGKGRQNKG